MVFFTSLHIPEDDTSLYRQRLTDLGAIAKAEKNENYGRYFR